MKTKLLTCVLALFSFISYCQTTSVPDLNFENYLETHDASGNVVSVGDAASMGDGINGNGLVTTSKISDVTKLDVTNKGIALLDGIQDFTALTTLIARNNNITTVNVASNGNLVHLDLYQNKLTAIDVTTNTELVYLNVGSPSKNTYNKLTGIDLQYNVVLDTLGLENNNLTALSVLNNIALTRLVCDRNSIVSLNLTNNNNLDLISCANNTGMTTLTLPPSAPLTRLDCYNSAGATGNGQLSGSLDVSMYPDLQVLWCYGNKFSGTLDLSSNTKIENVDCGDNDLTGLILPNDIGNFIRLICDGNNLTTLDLSQNEALEVVNCYGYWGNAITTLTLPNAPNLWSLNCAENDLNVLDVSSLPDLEYLFCHHNSQLTSITFNNPFLRYLYCNNSPMLSTLNNTLSLSGLWEFGLWYCDITSLDLSNSMVLQYLEPGGNLNLSNLVLPDTPTLTALWAYETNLSSSGLDYSKNTALQYLDLGITKFTSIDVSMLPNLVTFWGNLNPQLTSINLANGFNNILDYVRIEDNPSLTCIQVDNVAQAEAKIDWTKDAWASYNTDCTLSIEEVDRSSISIYPNPFKHKFYIELKSDANYSLTNVFGQEVRKGSLVLGKNELDTESLSSGLYMLNLETAEGKATKKLIKE